jgi:hypothetical protein
VLASGLSLKSSSVASLHVCKKALLKIKNIIFHLTFLIILRQTQKKKSYAAASFGFCLRHGLTNSAICMRTTKLSYLTRS